MMSNRSYPVLAAAVAVALLAGCCAAPEAPPAEEKARVHEMDEVATYGDTLKLSVLDAMTFMGRKMTPNERARFEEALELAREDPTVVIPTVPEVPDPKKGCVYLGVKVKLENVYPTDVPRGTTRLFAVLAESERKKERPKTYPAENRAFFFDSKDRPLKVIKTYKLRKGQAATGWIVFQVPKGGEDWVLRFGGRGAGALHIRVEIE